MLGLPEGITTLLFDLDGVLTKTAIVHNAAWKKMFDAYLKERSERTGEPFREFTQDDYEAYVDGKPRADGVRSFLESRGIELAAGSPGDPPSAETVAGLGNRKNELVLKVMAEQGVEAYPGSVKYVDAARVPAREGGQRVGARVDRRTRPEGPARIGAAGPRQQLHAARDAGLHRAVVSSSANCEQALEAAGIADRFEARVDGKTIEQEHLKGKPAPDTFIAGAKRLGTDPSHAAVFEDALAGVQAGRAGNFGFVVGVNRGDDEQRRGLKEHGADIVVDDLEELLS